MAQRPGDKAPLLEMADISKVYEMGEVKVHAVRDVNLTVYPGEFVAIVGPSGSGKTTLLNLIGCLDEPTTGRYVLRGQEIAKLSDRRIAQLRNEAIGFVFQNYSLLPAFDALRNVQLPHYYARGRGNRKKAMELLTRVGLAERAKHKPTELSGGEQQRVAVARALMNGPQMILGDEPTGNLDSASGQNLIDVLKELNRDQGLTVVVVSHDPAVSEQAQRVIHMLDGGIVEDEVRVAV
jgi:putative ABC transport system ATP-binding protein